MIYWWEASVLCGEGRGWRKIKSWARTELSQPLGCGRLRIVEVLGLLLTLVNHLEFQAVILEEGGLAQLKTMSKAFKALSNENRLRIYLEILKRRSKQVASEEHGCSLSEFMAHLNIGAPTVSHHIKELVNADLITVERHGKFMTCHLNEAMREQLEHFFKSG